MGLGCPVLSGGGSPWLIENFLQVLLTMSTIVKIVLKELLINGGRSGVSGFEAFKWYGLQPSFYKCVVSSHFTGSM